MKILLIGHSVVDFIHQNEDEKRSPGGVFYSAAALNSFKEIGDEIYLLTFMDQKNKDLFSFIYDDLDTGFIDQNEIPKVHLKIFDEAERCEWYENIAQNLDLNIIKDINSFNGILINMITGFDISIDQLKELRKNYKGKIYFDVHTLARGLDEKGARNFRLIPDAKEWIENVDIIQANENEIFTLSNLKDEKEIAEFVLNCGVEILIVTKGDKGGTLYTKNIVINFGKGESKNTNKIGLGDTFGAVFFYSYIKFQNFETALNYAVQAAAFAASYNDIKDFLNLKNDTLTRIN